MGKKCLVLKGGGVKGLIQASCLNELEKTGINFNEFDLIVGTSVGAINGSCIALGKTCKELLELYPSMIDKIFSKHWYPTVPKYDRKNFIEVYMGLFGMKRMKEITTKLIITSVDRCEDRMHYFKSWELKDGEEAVINIVLRSFAAPLYFGQLVDYKNKKVWIDGGCTIDNLPLDAAFIETLLLGWFNQDIEFYVLGTGFSNNKETFDEARKDKTIEQVMDFMAIGDGGMARSSSSFEQIRKMYKITKEFPNIKMKYYDIEIPKNLDKMDCVNKKKEYIQYGIEMSMKPLINGNINLFETLY